MKFPTLPGPGRGLQHPLPRPERRPDAHRRLAPAALARRGPGRATDPGPSLRPARRHRPRPGEDRQGRRHRPGRPCQVGVSGLLQGVGDRRPGGVGQLGPVRVRGRRKPGSLKVTRAFLSDPCRPRDPDGRGFSLPLWPAPGTARRPSPRRGRPVRREGPALRASAIRGRHGALLEPEVATPDLREEVDRPRVADRPRNSSCSAPGYCLTRSTYSPVRVSIRTFSPGPTNGGTGDLEAGLQGGLLVLVGRGRGP